MPCLRLGLGHFGGQRLELGPHFRDEVGQLAGVHVADGQPALGVYSLGVQSFLGFDDEAKLVAKFPFEMDCEQPDLIAPERALAQEIGGAPDAGMNRLIAFLSPFGLVHSEGCAGEKTLLAIRASCFRVELPSGATLTPKRSTKQLACDVAEEEWANELGRKYGLGALFELAVVAINFAGLPEDQRGPFA